MTIAENIIANPIGGTVPRDGLALPTTGYFVGGAADPLIIESATSPIIEPWLDGVGLWAEYIGWWTDSATGLLYVDAVSWHADRKIATRLAVLRDEIAFWDIENEQEIRCGL